MQIRAAREAIPRAIGTHLPRVQDVL